MKKRYLFPILIAICACGTNNTSSSNSNTSSNSFGSSSNSSTSSSSFESSSNTSSSKPMDKYINVQNKDLECILNEDRTGFIIYKYKKYDKYIRLPETFSGLFSHVYENETTGVSLDIYSGNQIHAEDVITLPIIGIMDKAFMSSGGVEDIIIPDSYIEFKHDAFFGCTSIKNYLVSDSHSLYKSIDGVLYTKDELSLFAFPLGRKGTYNVIEGTKNVLNGSFENTNIEEVVLPESVENIEDYAFYSAKRLRTINIPSKVKEIKEYTFNTCLDLKTINFSEGLEKIGYYAFGFSSSIKNLVFPSTLEIIEGSAFESVKSIRNLVFNEGLKSIGDYAFAYNEYIETITFPSTLKYIGKYAFIQNYELMELDLVEGIEVLDEGAFYYNTNLRKVNIPSTLQSIGYDCFTTGEYNPIGHGIEEYKVSEDSNYFKNVDGVVYSKDGKELVVVPTAHEFNKGSYKVLDGVERINDHAFYNCTFLKNITLPSSLKEIGKAPFYITNLNTINYEGGVEEFKLIQTTDEVFTSDTSTNTLVVKWNYTNENGGVSLVKCIDGDYSLIESL